MKDLKKVGNIAFETVATEWDVYFDKALAMLEEIMKNIGYEVVCHRGDAK